jgi:hypothetical protein
MKPIQMQFFKTSLIFLIASLPLIFLGYGSDGDSYGVLSAGISTWENSIPQMSRHPGYWLYEAMIFCFSKLGGYILTNGATLAASVFVLHRFHSLAVRENVTHAVLLTLCLCLNPWFLIAATSTMDYMWALLFIVLSIEFAIKDKHIIAGVFAGLAAGFRLGSVFVLLFAFIFSWIKAGIKNSLRGYVLLGCVSIVLIVIFYLPSWLLKEKNFSFLNPHLVFENLNWTPKLYAGRFFYKIIHLFGLPSFVIIAAIVAYYTLKQKGQINMSRYGIAALGASVGTLILFARYPIEIAYLLPFLFFFLLLLGTYLRGNNRKYLIAILLTTISYSFINLSIAKPNVPNKATDASFGLFVEPGVLIKDVFDRLKLIDCANIKCFHELEVILPQNRQQMLP